MRIRIYAIILLIIPAAATYAQNNKPYFTVEGEVQKPLTLTTEALSGFTQVEVTAKDRDGNEHLFTGVRLADILDSAGVTLGGELRGENLAKYVLVKAVDGYEVIFSLPEIDPEFTDQTILLAYQMDGKPLPRGEGPFRIVAPKDKKHARWIREINTIKIVFSKE